MNLFYIPIALFFTVFLLIGLVALFVGSLTESRHET